MVRSGYSGLSRLGQPPKGNAAMTIRGSCTFVRANRAGREDGVTPSHQTYVFEVFNPLFTKKNNKYKN